MDIYIAICCDRHIDEVVKVFTTSQAAIDFARKFVQDNAAYPEDVQEENIVGWLYYCRYSVEGDNVRVEKGVLDPES